jgi:UrcA family protein
MKTLSLIAATAALSISVISAAHAAIPDVAPSVSIHYGDLDLSRTEGAASLYNRLNSAAKSVCRELETSQLQMQYAACIEHAIKTAVTQINRSSFSEYVAARASSPRNINVAVN